MPTFIDESGDPGPSAGASRFFRLCAVCFETTGHMEKYLHSVESLKHQMGVSQNFEFHFAKISHQRRIDFFNSLADISFTFSVSTFEKHTYPEDQLSLDRIRGDAIGGLVEKLNDWYLCAEECSSSPAALNERVVFDESHDQSYIKNLKSGLRSLLSSKGDGKKLVGSVKPGKSKSDPCIQLADMVCGAVGRHLIEENVYYDLIRNKRWEIKILMGDTSGATN